MRIILLVLALAIGQQTIAAGNPHMVIEAGFNPALTILSNSENYLILGNDQQYELWDLADQTRLLAGQFRNKVSDWLSGVEINEGSGFLFIENSRRFITVEYRMHNAHFRAFDLADGSQVWENSDLKLGISWFRNVLPLLHSAAQNPEVSISLLGSQSRQPSANRIIEAHGGMISNDPAIGRLIHYIEDLNALVVNGHQGLQKINLDTGERIWVQGEITSMLGEVTYVNSTGTLTAFSVHSSEIEGLSSRPDIYHINPKDGSLIWTEQYIGNYRPESSYIVGGDILLTDFFGLSLLDLRTGRKMENEINENYSRAENALRVLSRLQPDEPIETITTRPLFNDKLQFYYVTGTHRGHAHPLTGNKILQKIDPVKGEIVFQSENLGGNQDVPVLKTLHDEILYVKMARRNQTFIHALHSGTGTLLFTTDRIRNRHDTDFDPFYLHKNTIIDLASNGIFFYDRLTGAQIEQIPFNDLDIGRLKTYFPYGEGFVIVGVRGLAFTDTRGQVRHSQRMEEVLSFHETADQLYLVGPTQLMVLDKESLGEVFATNYKPGEFILTGNAGKHWLHVQGRTIQINLM